jgi:hypothetical protein
VKRWGLGIVAIVVAVLGIGTASAAVVYEPQPPFCEEQVVHDYLAPLERLPTLPSPPVSGQLGVGPPSLRIKALPALVVGKGLVGYKLNLRLKAKAVHLRWRAITTLSRVDWHGDEVEAIARTDRRLGTIKAGQGAGVQFELDGVPAPYRVLTVIRNEAGKPLDRYGFYFRLVPAKDSARLALNASSYRPGQTVFMRVENLGTGSVTYGVPYSIEQLQGTTWSLAPQSPRGPWILPLLYSAPGKSGRCGEFRIPSDMPAGHYRAVKGITLGLVQRPEDLTYRTAEFDVLP